MKKIECPAEGCDYEKVPDSVLGHINAKSDPAHRDKGALRGAVEGAVDGDGPDDQGGDPPETEGGQADDEGGETTPEGTPEEGGEEAMTDTDEVSDQWNGSDDHPETEGGQADDDPADDPPATTPEGGADGGGQGGGIPVPVDATTLMVGVAILAIGVVVWQYAQTTGDDPPETEGGQADATTPSGDGSGGGQGGGSEAGGDDGVSLLE